FGSGAVLWVGCFCSYFEVMRWCCGGEVLMC
ncbi:hypothetical protein A2U01_0094476, partial [Trifolium medium]|nr:hypothetical protein [Trifolium medium]